MTRTLVAETLIHAPRPRVFEILADIPNYGRWNSWLPRCSGGETRVGAVFDLTVLLGGKPMAVRHRITAVRPPEHLAWCDMGWITWFAFGQRSRTLTTTADGDTHVRVELSIRGPLAWLALRLHGKNLQQGMTDELADLKRYAEAG